MMSAVNSMMGKITWDIPEPDVQGTMSWRPSARPDLDVKTWYRINGDLKNGSVPIITIHGGPGVPHDYILNWVELVSTGHPVVFYDQVGCGHSTELRDKEYQSLFTNDLFVEELGELLDHLKLDKVILAGQSYGAYIAQDYAGRTPNRVTGLILANGLQDFQECLKATRGRIPSLSQESQEAIRVAEEKEDYESEGFKKANEASLPEFVNAYIADTSIAPRQVMYSLGEMEKNTHVYGEQLLTHPMLSDGLLRDNEFKFTGNLAHASIASIVHQITVPVLVIWGSDDEVAGCQDAMVKRLTGSKKVTRVVIQGAKHLTHMDHPDEWLSAAKKWLNEVI